MHRLLIAAASAAFLFTAVAPAFADEYPMCTRKLQDNCREGGHQAHDWPSHHHHHPHH